MEKTNVDDAEKKIDDEMTKISETSKSIEKGKKDATARKVKKIKKQK